MKKLTIPLAALAAAVPVLASDPLGSDLNPLTDADYYGDAAFSQAQTKLGQMLFFDKILSGNKNISCATCHHPSEATSDGLALGIGEGGKGLGEDRHVPEGGAILGRVPRNSPALFNLGAREYVTMFHDGRVENAPDGPWASGFWTPAREDLPEGLENLLAAQAMFPVTSHIEMAGAQGDNPIADAAALDRLSGEDGVWALLANRLRDIPEYVELFQAAYPDIESKDDITYVHAANAIAAFETMAFRADDSPFDRYIKTGDATALAPEARAGMALFYGEAGCADCHSGPLQTDHEFHAIAMPQIGPGKGDGWAQDYWEDSGYAAKLEDYGRAKVTFRDEDRYRFRTPSLRNVELTGPWGHAGSYGSLEEVIRHHLDPEGAVTEYRLEPGTLPAVAGVKQQVATGSVIAYQPVNPARRADFGKRDGWVQQSPDLRGLLIEANELNALELSRDEIAEIEAFLTALTDPRSRDLMHLVPERVPSGLPVAD